MKTAAELKKEQIENMIGDAFKKGEVKAALGNVERIQYSIDYDYGISSINVCRAICKIEDVEYLKGLGYKVKVIKPCQETIYNHIKELSKPYKTGFFSRLFSGANDYEMNEHSIRALNALKTIDALPDVVEVSWGC